jgi:hypothetical protein
MVFNTYEGQFGKKLNEFISAEHQQVYKKPRKKHSKFSFMKTTTYLHSFRMSENRL